MPKLDPQEAAHQAVTQYDQDGDGVLGADELALSAALSAAQSKIDTDGDGRITADEIAARLNGWLERKQALHIFPCQVYWRGEPLTDATVRFVPEGFLGAAFHPAQGTTDQYGTASIVHAPEDRPDPDFPQGVRVGLYRVEISKRVGDREIIPAKYNVESGLGQEVAADAAGMGQGLVTFRLR
jgi:hypothetical protein